MQSQDLLLNYIASVDKNLLTRHLFRLCILSLLFCFIRWLRCLAYLVVNYFVVNFYFLDLIPLVYEHQAKGPFFKIHTE